MEKQIINQSLIEKSLEWFFSKNEIEKINLKRKYFPNEFISYDNHWGFHFDFGQIEKMFSLENNVSKHK